MALFKIFNNIDSKTLNTATNKYEYNSLPNTYKQGYMYFDASKNLFYIDTAGEGGSTGTRVALNAYGAEKAYADENDDRISTTYLKVSDASSITASSAERLTHTLTFGAGGQYSFDGSADVTVPVYDGTYI